MNARDAALAEPAEKLGSNAVRLREFVIQREALHAPFREAFAIAGRSSEQSFNGWCGAALAFLRVNPGLTCAISLFDVTARLGRRGDLENVIVAAETAEAICRNAGAQAAAAFLRSTESLQDLAGDGMGALCAALTDLARRRPDAVIGALAALPSVLPAIGPEAYAEWLAAGLRAYGNDRAKFRAYAALDDPLARQRLHDYGRAGALRRALPAAVIFATALNGEKLKIRHAQAARRSSLAPPILVLPEAYRNVSAERQGAVATAALAHAAAHRIFGGAERFDPKHLKPIQVVLTSLIEDARVETLAMRRWPGLRRLWQPFHTAVPKTARAVPLLLARLARALFDETYRDDETWITKASAMFSAVRHRIEDPTISREIGNLLGNDLGQMRLSFNPRTYVVEPLYRDDHAALWITQRPPDAEASEVDVMIEAMRRVQEERDDGTRRENRADEDTPAFGAKSATTAAEEGVVVQRLPEWDYAATLARPDWTTVKIYPPGAPLAEVTEKLLEDTGALAAKVTTLVRRAQLGLPRRLRHQAEGETLDIDRAIIASIARRTGETPDPRVYQRIERQTRDAATLLLIDTSESTRDSLPDRTRRVLEIEIAAAAILATAADHLGDRLAIEGFSSNGRDDVRIHPVKDFRTSFDDQALQRLCGLKSAYSTRLGSVLRHGGARLAGERAYRRVLITITDGEPFDIDCDDPLYLIEDARHAVQELRAIGIDTFGLGIGTSHLSGQRIFGRGNFVPVPRAEDLSRALGALYFRLAAR